jgi:hypothetical protein
LPRGRRQLRQHQGPDKRRLESEGAGAGLRVAPRTTYLGKLRNPNPAMPDYAALPLSRTEYEKKNNPHFGHESAHGDDHGKKDHGHSHETEKKDGHSSFFKGNNLFGGLS